MRKRKPFFISMNFQSAIYNYIDEILLCHVCALKAEYNIIRAENTYVWSAVIGTDLLKTVS